MSAPHIDVPAEGAIVVDDDSPLSYTLLTRVWPSATNLSKVKHSFATAYSKEKNSIVERTNQEVMRHIRAMLF